MGEGEEKMKLRLQTDLLLAGLLVQGGQVGAFVVSMAGMATIPGATELNPWGLHPAVFDFSATALTCIVIGAFFVGRRFPHPLMRKVLLSFPVSFVLADLTNDLIAFVLRDSYVAIGTAMLVAAAIPVLTVVWELDPATKRLSLGTILRRHSAK